VKNDTCGKTKRIGFDGKISRREALSTAAKIAISAVVAGVVAGVSGYLAGSTAAPVKTVEKTVERTIERTITRTETVTVTGTAPPPATVVTTPTFKLPSEEEMRRRIRAELEKANINWKKFAGKEIVISSPTHPFLDALKPLVPLFEDLTGIKVRIEELTEAEWNQKVPTVLASGVPTYDIVFCGPIYLWGWGSAGWLETLDKYLNNPELTDKDWYDFNDFLPATIKVSRWNARPGAPEGEGPLWMVPIMVETYLLAYREDLFKKWGLTAPGTWEDLLETVKIVKTKMKEEGLYGKMYPLTLRGTRLFITVAAYTAVLPAYGARDLDENLVPLYDSKEWIEANKIYTEIIKEGCPPPSTFFSINWYNVLDDMAAGLYAMTIDCDFFAATWENPEKSKVAGKLAYTTVPAGPAGRGARIWAWSLAIPRSSTNKEAAWLFIEWATSKPILWWSTVRYGNYMPVRWSVLNSPEVEAITKDWGHGTWREAVTEMYAKYTLGSYYTPLPEQITLLNIISDALHDIIADKKTVEEALKWAKQEAVKALKEAGYKLPV